MKRRFILTAIITLIVLIAIQAFRTGALSGSAAAKHWSWQGDLGEDGWVNIRNTTGSITVLQSSDGQVSVQAQNSWKGGNPAPLAFIVNREGGSLFICAMNSNSSKEADCSQERYRPGRRAWWERLVRQQRTPTVAFTVRVPDHTSLNLKTVNGSVSVKGEASALVASTVNGSISTAYPLRSMNARTVNGAIRAKLSGMDSGADMKLETVNGSVSAEIPADANISLRASTVHGRVRSDFPVTTSDDPGSKSMSGVIGSGGATLVMATVNGAITLSKLLDAGNADSATEAADSASVAPPARD
jgi:hypothetical protein